MTELAASVMTEINLRTTAAQLQAELKHKEEFITIAAHELKTPLTTLQIHLQLIARKTKKLDSFETTNSIESMKRQVSRLQTLSNDLLDATRIVSGQLKITPVSFEVI